MSADTAVTDRLSARQAPVRSDRRRIDLRGTAPLLGALIAWQVLGDPDSPLFPPPSAWWFALADLAASGELLYALRATAGVGITALAIALVVGVGLGSVLGSHRDLDRGNRWVVALCQTVPAPVLVPVVTLLVGAGFGARVGLVAFVAVWPVLVNVMVAIDSVHLRQADVVAVFGVGRRARVLKVLLPSILPGIYVGFRLAAPLALVITLLVEMLTFTDGLGVLLVQAQRSYLADQTYGLLVLVGLIGLALNTAIELGEQAMFSRRRNS